LGTEHPGPAQGLRVMGGHHRLNELYRRFVRGEIDGELEIAVLYERWNP
jgi:hypothetical protein